MLPFPASRGCPAPGPLFQLWSRWWLSSLPTWLAGVCVPVYKTCLPLRMLVMALRALPDNPFHLWILHLPRHPSEHLLSQYSGMLRQENHKFNPAWANLVTLARACLKMERGWGYSPVQRHRIQSPVRPPPHPSFNCDSKPHWPHEVRGDTEGLEPGVGCYPATPGRAVCITGLGAPPSQPHTGSVAR